MYNTLNQINEYLKTGRLVNRYNEAEEKCNFERTFCGLQTLPKRAAKLYRKLNTIKQTVRFDLESTFVCFNNNARSSGPTYDSINIYNFNEELLYKLTFEKGNYKAFKKEELVSHGKWKDIKDYFIN